MHQQISDLLEKNQSLNDVVAKSANFEKLQEDSNQIINNLRLKLNQMWLNFNDMAAEKRLIEEKMCNLNMELQTIRVQNSEEQDVTKQDFARHQPQYLRSPSENQMRLRLINA